ncbi:hypothetical protein ABFX02_05G097700 [Erythranthe guttata]|uniref:uncharacterized protein LOC105977453 n=1 Tax=Erythranthe guttata TaxID=4155 RepID=UPI00064DA7FF|nr:PREDICTED: uncharacterized protein LOC105977453 [Erythranthe guttata]|eukprot:XP_012858216.1 PREDICTED: uncharacterized protein LOC105977453 [Erythranthe guttata]
MSYRSSTLFSPMFVSSQGMYALMVGCSADEFFLPPPSTLSLCLLPPVQIRSFNQLKHIHKLLLLICLEMLIETTSCLLGHDDLCVYFTPFLLILSVICIYLDM